MIDIISKYLELITTDEFHEYSFEFADTINNAIPKNNSIPEPNIVKEIVEKINGLSKSIRGITIKTNAVFIHGSKSQVKFKYNNDEIQKELGDLIFMLSVIYQSKKHIEKLTISQTKKLSNNKWNIDKEQLFLLSYFPPFERVSGIVPKGKIYLRNLSKTLGSYSLLSPDNFIYTSAPLLKKILRSQNSITESSLLYRVNSICCFNANPCNPLMLCHYPMNFFYRKYLLEDFIPLWRTLPVCRAIPFCCCLPVLGNSHFAPDTYYFVDQYLRGCIGELIFSSIHYGYNRGVFNFVKVILNSLKQKANNGNDFINNLNNDLYSNITGGSGGNSENFDFGVDGGDLGFIHTIINLGE